MGDYGQEWADEQARKLAAHIGRTVETLRSLGDRYARLPGLLVPGREGGNPDELIRYGGGGSRVPLRTDVVDAMVEVEAFAGKYGPLVRGALRLGTGSRAVPDVVQLMRSGLGRVYAEDGGLGDEVSRGAWRLHGLCVRVAGEGARAFPLAEPCGACGMRSLWASPELLEVRCGHPECRASWRLDSSPNGNPAAVYSSET